MRNLVYILPIILLSACVTTSGIVHMDRDTYTISRSEKGLITTNSKATANALKEAEAFCISKNKKIEVLRSSHKDLCPLKFNSQVEVDFQCVSDE